MEYKVMIEDEEAYPIYSLHLTFTMVKDGVLFPNAVNPNKMFKEIPLKSEITEWINKIKDKQVEYRRAYNFTQDVKLLRYETWKLVWFQHETFDVGQTDQEALESFSKYVERHRCDYERWDIDDDRRINAICLMGAEDRYRWCGSEPGGGNDGRSNPPCRCKFCKEQGVIRIGH